MDSTSPFLSLLFGSVGVGYFIYGKRESRFIPMLAGAALCGFPYFVSNIYVMLAIGIVLVLLPFLVRV